MARKRFSNIVIPFGFYTGSIINDYLLYQDDRDQCRLHICDINGQNDSVLIDDVVFEYVLQGTAVYYKTIDKPVTFDNNGRLVPPQSYNLIIKQYDLYTKKTKTVIDNVGYSWGIVDGVIYYSNRNDSFRLYSYRISDGSIDILSQDKNTQPFVFTDDGMFCYVYNDKGQESDYYFIRYNTYKKTQLIQ